MDYGRISPESLFWVDDAVNHGNRSFLVGDYLAARAGFWQQGWRGQAHVIGDGAYLKDGKRALMAVSALLALRTRSECNGLNSGLNFGLRTPLSLEQTLANPISYKIGSTSAVSCRFTLRLALHSFDMDSVKFGFTIRSKTTFWIQIDIRVTEGLAGPLIEWFGFSKEDAGLIECADDDPANLVKNLVNEVSQIWKSSSRAVLWSPRRTNHGSTT